MQTIVLKEGFENIFSKEFMEKSTQENEFIYFDSNELNISYNLDINDMHGSILGDEESNFFEFVYEFEKNFSRLKDYFVEEFEIVYFTYNEEYKASMWKFHDGKLLKNSDWIGGFCKSCEDIEDEDDKEEEQNRFVDDNYPDLKAGNPTEELLEGLREGLILIE
jgi:hypothetical protein